LQKGEEVGLPGLIEKLHFISSLSSLNLMPAALSHLTVLLALGVGTDFIDPAKSNTDIA